MEGVPVSEENRKAVELAIMVEAGTAVREMSTMTKEMRSKCFHREYLGIITDMSDSRFVDGSVRQNMMQRFKGMRGTEMTAENLLRKYEGEMTTLKKKNYTYLPLGNLSSLPSGTTQLQQLKRPIIAKIWKIKFPVSTILYIPFVFFHQSCKSYTLFSTE